MNKTKIEWTDSTWSPLRVRVRHDAAEIAKAKGYTSLVEIAGKMAGRVGPHCEHVSPGCENCYAETNNHRCLPANGTGLPYDRRSRDLVEAFVDEKILLQPLRWKKVFIDCEMCGATVRDTCMHGSALTPGRWRARRIFVENQSDIFGEWYTDEMLDRIFAVMALAPQHTFQILTKRPERMLEYLADRDHGHACGRIAAVVMKMRHERGDHRPVGPLPHLYPGAIWWPLANVHLGVSVENQANADERIPLLLRTPADVRFISAEPLLGPLYLRRCGLPLALDMGATLDWVIVGGESGPGARSMQVKWAQSIVEQCEAADVSCFVKQLGANPLVNTEPGVPLLSSLDLSDKKGGDWNEWPEGLRIREFPEVSP